MTAPSIVWFRDDLRVSDNPALHAAAQHGGPIVCLYILDDASPGIRPLGGAARWWLHHSLSSLASSLRDIGLELTLRRGAADDAKSDELGGTDARIHTREDRDATCRRQIERVLGTDPVVLVDGQDLLANLIRVLTWPGVRGRCR